MTPSSDSLANQSGFGFEDKPEQLHKEPESASPGRGSSVASGAPPATTPIVATHSKTATTTSTHLGDLASYEDNNNNNKDRNMKLRLSSGAAELPFKVAVAAEDDDDELTSLFAHLDEVKRDLDLLVNCTTRAAKITTTIAEAAADETKKNHRQEVERKSREMRDHLSLISKSPVGLVGRGCSSSGAVSSSSLQGTLGEQLSVDPTESLIERTGAKSAENFERKQATTSNNIILIVQHLIQKRNELRCIDRKLFDIMTQYLVQLELFPEQVGRFRLQHDDFEKTIHSHLLLDNEFEMEPPQIFRENRLAWRHQKRQQQHPYAAAAAINLGSWPSLRPPPPPVVERLQSRRQPNEAMDLSLEGAAKYRKSRSSAGGTGGQSILLPPSSGPSSMFQNSTCPSKANQDLTENGITGTAATATSLNDFDGRLQQPRERLISDTNNQNYPQNNPATANNDNMNNNDTNSTGQATAAPRKQFSVNLKKSRLLGANLYPDTNTTTTTLTNTQRCSNYLNNNNNDDADPSQAELTQTYHQASPLNLLKRNRTPSPQATISQTTTTSATKPPAGTSSPSSDGGGGLAAAARAMKSEMQNQSSSREFHQAQMGSRQIILSPLTTPAIPVISSNCPGNPMRPDKVLTSSTPELEVASPEAPLSKRFRSFAQVVYGSDQQHQQQVVLASDHYKSLLLQQQQQQQQQQQHYMNDGNMTLLSLHQHHHQSQSSSETLNFDVGSLATIVNQAHQNHSTSAFDYSLQQHHFYSQQSTVADHDDNHPLAKQSIDSYSPGSDNIFLNNCKQSAPIGCPTLDQTASNNYIMGQQQQNIQHSDSPPSCPMTMTMMVQPAVSHLNDFNGTTSTCNSVVGAAAASRETLELMRLDKDHLYQYNYVLPGAQQLAQQPLPSQPQQLYQMQQHHVQREFNHQKIAYRCHVCGSSFEDRHRLQQHLSIHLNLHPSWFEETTIKETMARYESKRGDYLCSSCNQRFETTADFDRHMHLHGDKPHQCELCNQDNKLVSFRYYRQLLTHLRSHCFLYSCRFVPDCKQTANRKDYLKLHILKHHLNNKLPENYTVCCH